MTTTVRLGCCRIRPGQTGGPA